MTRSEALAVLIEKVEAGERPHYKFRYVALGDDLFHKADGFGPAYDGSLDAAVAFVDAVLPGWGWEVFAGGGAIVWRSGEDRVFNHITNNPARALLLAALRALAAQGAQE